MDDAGTARASQVFGFGALERTVPYALVGGVLAACVLPFVHVTPGYRVIAWGAGAIIAALYVYAVVIACTLRIELDDETLVVQGGPIRHVLARRDIPLDRVRRFTHTRLWELEQPLRRGGFHIPGFSVRQYSGAGQKTVVAVLTARDAVLVPAGAFDLVVSPVDIDGFLAALGVSAPAVRS